MKKISFILALIVLYFVNTNFAQQTAAEKSFEVRGFVKNQGKISLAGSTLFFESNKTRTTIATDENGAFTVKLPVGKYKVTVNPAISKNFVAFIEIFDSNLNPTDFDLVVEMNKACCTETSDEKVTEVVKFVSPKYPAAARAIRAAGEVVVSLEISGEGDVTSAQVESGHPLLRQTAEQAAKQWRFSSDPTESKRQGKIIFVFVNSEKKKADIFTKPNRLEVFAEPALLNY